MEDYTETVENIDEVETPIEETESIICSTDDLVDTTEYDLCVVDNGDAYIEVPDDSDDDSDDSDETTEGGFDAGLAALAGAAVCAGVVIKTGWDHRGEIAEGVKKAGSVIAHLPSNVRAFMDNRKREKELKRAAREAGRKAAQDVLDERSPIIEVEVEEIQ